MLANRVEELLRSGQIQQAMELVQIESEHAADDELETVALKVARMFMDGQISFQSASIVVCPIWEVKFGQGLLPPAIAYDVYWALDGGEYGDPGRPTDDPVEYRVRPAIAAILAKHGA